MVGDDISVFVDNSTRKIHIANVEFFHNEQIISYMSITDDDERSKPIKISGNAFKDSQNIKITGSSDGLHLFMAYGRARNQTRGAFDIFFSESSDDGLTWSSPILPRSNNLEDINYRQMPDILITRSERLLVFYRIRGKLLMTTREKGSSIWSAEKNILSPLCEEFGGGNSMSITSVKSGKEELIVQSYTCNGKKGTFAIIAESNDNGNTWKYITPNIGNDLIGSLAMADKDYGEKLYFSQIESNDYYAQVRFFLYLSVVDSKKLCHFQSTALVINQLIFVQ